MIYIEKVTICGRKLLHFLKNITDFVKQIFAVYSSVLHFASKVINVCVSVTENYTTFGLNIITFLINDIITFLSLQKDY